MSQASLEIELKRKTNALNQMIRRTGQGVSLSEFKKLKDEVLRLERLRAQNSGGVYAREWPLPGIWTGMILNCVLVGDECACSLVYDLKPKAGEFKIFEFRQIAGYKFTDVSDEIIAAHPLMGRGLAAYGSFVIENSPWLKELELIDRSHPQFGVEKWRATKHYLLCFKDRMFEVLAMAARLVGEASTREAAIDIALKRLDRKKTLSE